MKVIKEKLFPILLVFFIVLILVILGVFAYKVINKPVTDEIRSNQFEEIEEKQNKIEKSNYFISENPIDADDLSGFSESIASIKKNGKWGFIDKNGNEVIPCIYDSVENFENGFAVVESNGMYGYIDTQGNIVGQIDFDALRNISNNLGIGVKDDQYCILEIQPKK